MCTLNDIKFQTCQDGITEEKYLVVTADLQIVPSNFKFDFSNQSTNDVYVILSRDNYSIFQGIAGEYPVTKNKIEILDHNLNTICVMPNKRSKNRFGNIPININNNIAFTEFEIPVSKINPDATYYIEFTNYQAFTQLKTTDIKKRLIQSDLFAFASKYSNLNFRIGISSDVFDFIKQNFVEKDIPPNIGFIGSPNYRSSVNSQIINNLCEEIFGTIISKSNQKAQGDIFFKIGNEILNPIFVSQTNTNISCLLKTRSIQYTGQGSKRFMVILKGSSIGKVHNDNLVPLIISNEFGDNTYFNGDYSSNTNFEPLGISELIRSVIIFKGLDNHIGQDISGFITENITEIVQIKNKNRTNVIIESISEVDTDSFIIKSQIKAISKKISERLISFWETDTGNVIVNKRKADCLETPCRLTDLMNGMGGMGGMDAIAGLAAYKNQTNHILQHSISAGICNHTAIGQGSTPCISYNEAFDEYN